MSLITSKSDEIFKFEILGFIIWNVTGFCSPQHAAFTFIKSQWTVRDQFKFKFNVPRF